MVIPEVSGRPRTVLVGFDQNLIIFLASRQGRPVLAILKIANAIFKITKTTRSEGTHYV